VSERLDFRLPAELRAGQPPEARGLGRDGVRMVVAYRGEGRLVGSEFRRLPSLLTPEDLVVINTSATLPAAVSGTDVASGTEVVVHLSTRLGPGPGGTEIWAVEPRRPTGSTTKRWLVPGPALAGDAPPRLVRLDGDGAHLELLAPYRGSHRLWTARLSVAGPVLNWLAEHGRPVRYEYVQGAWPLSAYQNVYATEPGSAEMPSAGRPFTTEMITRLVAAGVGVAPVLLHTGVASLEADELPYPERVRVTSATARRVMAVKAAGGRVLAVGTTVVRALESAFDVGTGRVEAIDGWTELVITPERGVHVVDGLLTGWHEPEASHLLMLEALTGRALLEPIYTASLQMGYLWHEFGDVALVLP
jgi:S-adenosylmethionine:tRNA ribosyltransferase-isomerase